MGRIYEQLSIEERTMIQTQLEMGIRPAAIAKGLNRAASTVSRELHRNGWARAKTDRGPGRPPVAGGCRAAVAHQRARACTVAPRVERPGQRQAISAASAVNAKGAFWFCTYIGGLNGVKFVGMLKRMMRRRRPLYLILDNLPAHKTAQVREYVASCGGKLELHFLPGYAPDPNPDELVWSHVKRTGTARRPRAPESVS